MKMTRKKMKIVTLLLTRKSRNMTILLTARLKRNRRKRKKIRNLGAPKEINLLKMRIRRTRKAVLKAKSDQKAALEVMSGQKAISQGVESDQEAVKTRALIGQIQAWINQLAAEIRARIDLLAAEIKAWINRLAAEIRARIDLLAAETKAWINQLAAEIKAWINQQAAEIKALINLAAEIARTKMTLTAAKGIIVKSGQICARTKRSSQKAVETEVRSRLGAVGILMVLECGSMISLRCLYFIY